MKARKQLRPESYTVGWLCALPLTELVAARSMLDERHQPCELSSDDENTYVYGSINRHNVVIACMPPGMPGKLSALRLTQPLSRSFPNMKIHLFVGIGGGIPRNPAPKDPEQDIHLGDVVVGWAEQTGVPAVVQYDFRRAEKDGKGQLLGVLDKPDRRLLNALGMLLANHVAGETDFANHVRRIEQFAHPGVENDRLFKPTYDHPDGIDTCDEACDPAQLVDRPPRQNARLVFHQGTILSGDSVMKNALLRDKLAEQLYGAVCFEMEAAGVMDEKHCLVIRGISDYSDSHKNHSWQGYAAAAAAAFAREFLYTIEPRIVQRFKDIQWKPVFKVPFDRDTNGTARNAELDRIERIFKTDHRVALAGIAGVGKSHTALEYCYRYHDAYPENSVIWVYSGTTSRFQERYRDIAMTLKLPGWNDKGFNEIKLLVRGWLAAEENPGWLMVIANATEDNVHASWSEYVPLAPNRRILITTSNRRVANQLAEATHIIDLHPLSATDAESLLRQKLLQETDPAHIAQLVMLLRGIPLALTQAAAYINKDNHMKITRYIAWFGKNDDNKATLLEEDMGGGNNSTQRGDVDIDHEDTATATTPPTLLKAWEQSFEQIQRSKPQAADLLSLLSQLDPAKIPAFILPNDTSSLGYYTDALRPLMDYSFLSVVRGDDSSSTFTSTSTSTNDDDEECFQMVDLVQIAARKWLASKGQLHIWQARALGLLAGRFRGGDYESAEGWRACAALAPHAERVLERPVDGSSIAETEAREAVMRCRGSLLRSYTFYMWRSGQVEVCRARCEESVRFHEEYLGDQRLLVLESRALKGLVHNSLGEHATAVEVHEEVLGERRRLLTERHEQTVSSMNDLGQALKNNRQYGRAQKMFEKALEGRRKVHGVRNLDTLTSMSDLAGVLVDVQKYDAAEKEFRTVLKEKESYLGKEHPSTLETMEHLAEVLARKGNYKDSESMHREVLDLYVSVLGVKHPDTIWSINGLAAVLLEQKKFQEAEEKFRETVDLCTEVLKLDNVHTLSVMHNLASVLEEQGKNAEAEDVLRDAISRMRILLGDTHEMTRDCMAHLAMVLKKQDKNQEAEEMRMEVIRLDNLVAPQTGLLGRVVNWVGYLWGTS